jgi:glyoxylase-like metal-dependent hydrolase (beta-lactamase superfamily II)
MDQNSPPTAHFQLHELAEGVYAAIANPNGGAVSNAGIVDLGDRTLVFDTLLTPRAAAELRVSAEQIGGRTVTFAINSHWHNDHVRGNQVFSTDTEILSTRVTRHLIETEGVIDVPDDASSTSLIRSLEPQDRPLDDGEQAWRAEISSWSNFLKEIAESSPRVKLRMPTWTFEGRLLFYGERRRAELIEIGAAHSQNDCLLYLPDDRIAFVGDLLFVQSHPYLGESDLDAWLQALDLLRSLDLLRIVPGHGPIAGPAEVVTARKYLLDLRSRVSRLLEKDTPLRSLETQKVPVAYADWKLERFYTSNLRTLYLQSRAAASRP